MWECPARGPRVSADLVRFFKWQVILSMNGQCVWGGEWGGVSL